MNQGFLARLTRAHSNEAPKPVPEMPPLPQEPRTPAVEEIVRDIVRLGLPTAPRKAAVSLRLDADVLDWLKAQGAGYQTRINAVLRVYMEAST